MGRASLAFVIAQAFPTLEINAAGFHANGSFAQAQAMFLRPDLEVVRALDANMAKHDIGIVAHFYMDAELQGVLYECEHTPVEISDSLAMADRAVQMAKAGTKRIVVLGVDFMAENVRAMLRESGYGEVEVYRVQDKRIGCSLADAAESKAYEAYLRQAAEDGPALHVIYINTSLTTKAIAQRLLPTITCTSSNVLATLLQAYSQVPELKVYFGPDSYMGSNLEQMLERFAGQSPEAVAALHAEHTPQSIAAARSRFDYFKQGTCIVHHMFGQSVVQQVQRDHQDAHIAAHLEVPGEMFSLAAQAANRGKGVVGSTSNILNYIIEQVKNAPQGQKIPVVLGTEAGMVTSIVRALGSLLSQSEHRDKSVEIIFPVSSQAVAMGEDESLPVVPGVTGGEGCSTAGGCATCPYMKMNSLDTLEDLVDKIAKGATAQELGAYMPKAYEEELDGHSVAHWGKEPIVEMRHFQQQHTLSPALIERIRGAR